MLREELALPPVHSSERLAPSGENGPVPDPDAPG
jgi:hypothetical protein